MTQAFGQERTIVVKRVDGGRGRNSSETGLVWALEVGHFPPRHKEGPCFPGSFPSSNPNKRSSHLGERAYHFSTLTVERTTSYLIVFYFIQSSRIHLPGGWMKRASVDSANSVRQPSRPDCRRSKKNSLTTGV